MIWCVCVRVNDGNGQSGNKSKLWNAHMFYTQEKMTRQREAYNEAYTLAMIELLLGRFTDSVP